MSELKAYLEIQNQTTVKNADKFETRKAIGLSSLEESSAECILCDTLHANGWRPYLDGIRSETHFLREAIAARWVVGRGDDPGENWEVLPNRREALMRICEVEKELKQKLSEGYIVENDHLISPTGWTIARKRSDGFYVSGGHHYAADAQALAAFLQGRDE